MWSLPWAAPRLVGVGQWQWWCVGGTGANEHITLIPGSQGLFSTLFKKIFSFLLFFKIFYLIRKRVREAKDREINTYLREKH